jgi:hypothetical protein
MDLLRTGLVLLSDLTCYLQDKVYTMTMYDTCISTTQ